MSRVAPPAAFVAGPRLLARTLQDVALARAAERTYLFLDELPGLDPVRLRSMSVQTNLAVRRAAGEDLLRLVAEGRWTVGHDDVAKSIHRQARRQAARLTTLRRRRALSRALEGAAIVVLTDWDGREVLSPSVRARLLDGWFRLSAGEPEARSVTPDYCPV